MNGYNTITIHVIHNARNENSLYTDSISHRIWTDLNYISIHYFTQYGSSIKNTLCVEILKHDLSFLFDKNRSNVAHVQFYFLIFFDTFLYTMYACIRIFLSNRFWLRVESFYVTARRFSWRCRFIFMLVHINTFYLPSLFMTRYMRKMFPHSVQKLEIFDFSKSLQLFALNNLTSALEYIFQII